MNKKRILILLFTILFILLNIAGIFVAILSGSLTTTLSFFGFSAVFGIFLYFKLKKHSQTAIIQTQDTNAPMSA